MSENIIINRDCLLALRDLSDKSVNCCVTSPPYYALRDYGMDAQIGREDSPEEYIRRLVLVFREVRRVLTDDGTLWLNIADTYCGTGNKGGCLDPKNPNGCLRLLSALTGGICEATLYGAKQTLCPKAVKTVRAVAMNTSFCSPSQRNITMTRLP